MWGRKAARIADLEARNALLAHQLAGAREDVDAWKWAAHRSDDRVIQQDQQRRERRAKAQNALATQRARITRYQQAWQSACRQRARYRAELASQQRVIDRLTQQLFDAMGYGDADRAALERSHTSRAA